MGGLWGVQKAKTALLLPLPHKVQTLGIPWGQTSSLLGRLGSQNRTHGPNEELEQTQDIGMAEVKGGSGGLAGKDGSGEAGRSRGRWIKF